MDKYKTDPLSKYVPNSPSSSPHRYHQDSFEAEQLSRQLPNPSFEITGQNNYELTFKKQMHQQYFSRDPSSQVNRLLFKSNEKSLIDCLRLPLREYYSKSLQELTNVPFADLMSLSLQPFLKDKLSLIGQILQVKRMRMKISSVSINIKCLNAKENQNYQQKNRVFLLQLLQKQLSKKLFLQALKLNQTHNSFIRQFASRQQQFLTTTPQNTYSQIPNEELYAQTSQRQPPSYYSLQQQEQEVDQNMEQRMMIFIHGIDLIVQKVLFNSFNKIYKYAPSHQQENYIKNTSYNQCESIPLISRPNFMDSSQQYQKYNIPQQNSKEDAHQAQISQSKLEELYSYIQALHEQCAQTNNILKKYFIKWKIHLLQSIAQSILNQIKPDNSMNQQYQEEEQEQNPQTFQQQQQQKQQQRQYSQVNRQSRLTSELSHAQNTLKSQKKALKEYLRHNHIINFYNRLRDYSEVRKISLICVSMFRQNTLRKSLFALKQNVKQQQFQRQMQDYYEQISNNQMQDDGTSKLFYKTNLLFSHFKQFKQYFRTNKLFRATQSTVIKTAFKQMVFYSIELKRHNEVTVRRLQYCRNNLMFKYFNYWKQTYLHQHTFNNKIKVYLQIKDKQTLQHCFSLLKLQFKRGLLKSRKAQQFYQNTLKMKIFYAIKDSHEDNKFFNERIQCLKGYLVYSKGFIFMNSFKQYYQDYIEYQRFSIKQQKLRRTLIKLHALQSIKQWRKNHTKKQAYEAIQMKLVRLRNKQRKRQILSQWYQKTLKILYKSGSSNKSQKHKDWLVQYYGNLCSVLPQ